MQSALIVINHALVALLLHLLRTVSVAIHPITNNLPLIGSANQPATTLNIRYSVMDALNVAINVIAVQDLVIISVYLAT